MLLLTFAKSQVPFLNPLSSVGTKMDSLLLICCWLTPMWPLTLSGELILENIRSLLPTLFYQVALGQTRLEMTPVASTWMSSVSLKRGTDPGLVKCVAIHPPPINPLYTKYYKIWYAIASQSPTMVQHSSVLTPTPLVKFLDQSLLYNNAFGCNSYQNIEYHIIVMIMTHPLQMALR